MDRAAARSLLLMHARSGLPMHPKTRDRAVAACEWDEEFERSVTAHADAHKFDLERERRDRAALKPYMDRLRDLLTS